MNSLLNRPAIPRLVHLTQVSFFLATLVWVCFGAYFLVKAGTSSPEHAGMSLILAGLMLGNAAVLFWLGLNLGKQQKRYLYLAGIYLVINLILGIADQIGIADVLYLVLVAGMLVLILANRSYYLDK